MKSARYGSLAKRLRRFYVIILVLGYVFLVVGMGMFSLAGALIVAGLVLMAVAVSEAF